MRTTFKAALVTLAVAGVTAAASIAWAVPAADDFDRADGPLSAPWTVQNGTFAISGNTAVGSGSALATYDGATGSTVSADIAMTASDTQYAAVVLDYLDLANNIFVKVQNNNGTPGFDTVFCYEGNNGSPFDGTYFFSRAEFTTAHLEVTIEVDRDIQIVLSDIDGAPGSELFTCPGAPVTGGTGVGIAGFAGGATVDNFVAGEPDTTPPTVTCDAEPTFVVGESGQVTASVTDAGSGPESATVTAAADTATTGSKSVELTGSDLAGNETTVVCGYEVQAAAQPTTTSTTSAPGGQSAPRAQAATAQPSYAG